ncbi:MAG: polyprenyl synthetase family protein [Ilumatobacter sp.]|nr:polyprenyl synthetase family protein [Ilumatobacter sp.]
MPDAPVSSPLLSLPGMDTDRGRIEAAMRAAVVTSDPYLTEIASHLIVAGGKRLRPVLSVVAGRLAGGAASDDVVQGGVACELVHLGSLYHDDVMDEAETRRGVETVNARWGNLQAILAGDFLLSRASEIAASLGTEVAGLLARTIGWLCEGQIEELRHTYDVERPEASYLASIHGKTASLYGTAARIGGIVAGLDRPTIEALTTYGNAYGMVFQIVDDVLDLTATDQQLGKPAGHDMEEGVYTLPVLYTLATGRGSADELRALLGKPLAADERDQALAIVRSDEGIERTIVAAREHVAAAVVACDDLGDGLAVDALREAPGALLATVLSGAAG